MQLAQEHGAQYFTIEHRFYGDSQPNENWEMKNFKFLRVEFVIEDIKVFIQ